MQGVVDTVLLFLHFCFGGRTDLDDSDTAGKSGDSFTEVIPVIFGFRSLKLGLQGLDMLVDGFLLSGTLDNRGMVLRNLNGFGTSENLLRNRVGELHTRLVGHHCAAGQHRDVAEVVLPGIAVARCLHCTHLQSASQFVQDEHREGFRIHILGDNENRLAGLPGVLEVRKEILYSGNLMFVHEDERVLENGDHLLLIGHEVRGEVSVIELHALDHVEHGFRRIGFLYSDDAVRTDLLHGVGDHITDFGIAVRRYGSHLGDGLLVVHLNGILVELVDDGGHGLVDTGLDFRRVGAGCHDLHSFLGDGPC